MAVKRKYTDSLPVQLTPEWRERIKAVADHEAVGVSMAEVIRDCIEVALPSIELALQIRAADELTELAQEMGTYDEPAPVREDRSAGLFGGPPKPRG